MTATKSGFQFTKRSNWSTVNARHPEHQVAQHLAVAAHTYLPGAELVLQPPLTRSTSPLPVAHILRTVGRECASSLQFLLECGTVVARIDIRRVTRCALTGGVGRASGRTVMVAAESRPGWFTEAGHN